MIGYIGFILICIVGFSIALTSIKKALYFFSFVFVFNFFIPISGKNINSTEFLFFIIVIVFWLKKIAAGNFFLLKSRPMMYLYFFFITSFSTILTTKISLFYFIHYFRLFLYLNLFYISYTTLKNIRDWYTLIGYIKAGFFILLIILFMEWVYINIVAENIVQGAIQWKMLLLKFGLYPQTAGATQLIGWSGNGSMVGVFPIHHALAVYLSGIFFLFLSGPLLKSEKTRIGDILGIAISFLFLLLTFSRSSIIGLLLALVLLLIIRFKTKFVLPGFLALVILLIPIWEFGLNNDLKKRIKKTPTVLYSGISIMLFGDGNISSLRKVDTSIHDRVKYDLNSIKMIQNNFLLGSGREGFKIKGDSQANPHGTLLSELQTKGIIPVIFLFLFFVYFYKRIRFLLRNEFHNKYLYWSLGTLLSFLIISFGTNIINDFRIMTMLLFSLIFSEIVSNNSKRGI
jgi:hypothetical protein